jgi:hypothetical protein
MTYYVSIEKKNGVLKDVHSTKNEAIAVALAVSLRKDGFNAFVNTEF